MTSQPTAKGNNKFDLLCWTLVAFGALCLAASVPQTYAMVRVAHDSLGAVLLVVVLEVMAFFALLAPIWVPTWAKTFERLALTLLGINTLGNFAGGWKHLWLPSNSLDPFWRGVRDWEVFGYPLAAVLLVAVLSGAVPAAMKFFLGLAVKRYQENEIDQTPEAVAQRAIEPMLVQILATRRLEELLLGAAEESKRPLVLPFQMGSEGEQRHPFLASAPVGRPPIVDTASDRARLLDGDTTVESARPEKQLYGGRTDDEEAEEEEVEEEETEEEEDDLDPPPTVEEALEELSRSGWSGVSYEVLEALPDSPEKVAELERRAAERERLKAALLKLAHKFFGTSPEGREEYPEGDNGAPEAAEAASRPSCVPLTWACAGEGCGRQGTNAQKGVATRWGTKRGLSGLYCEECRAKLDTQN